MRCIHVEAMLKARGNGLPLEAVVDILGKREELRRALDNKPPRRKADIIYQRRQAGEYLGDPRAGASS